MVATLEENIAAYEAMRGELEQNHLGKWVVFYDLKCVGVFDTLDAAAKLTTEQFGQGQYLIREVTNYPIRLPVSAFIGGNPAANH